MEPISSGSLSSTLRPSQTSVWSQNLCSFAWAGAQHPGWQGLSRTFCPDELPNDNFDGLCQDIAYQYIRQIKSHPNLTSHSPAAIICTCRRRSSGGPQYKTSTCQSIWAYWSIPACLCQGIFLEVSTRQVTPFTLVAAITPKSFQCLRSLQGLMHPTFCSRIADFAQWYQGLLGTVRSHRNEGYQDIFPNSHEPLPPHCHKPLSVGHPPIG